MKTRLGIFWALVLTAGAVLAQDAGSNAVAPFELSDAVQLDEVDGAVRAQLDRAKSLLADRQWDEAVEILRRLSEGTDDRLLDIGPRRYARLCDACGGFLAAMPSEALKLYRARVDPVARQWYEEGIARRKSKLLESIADRMLASSYGDAAIMALGSMALESGRYAAARAYWQRILEGRPPTPSPQVGRQSIADADVRARLVLASILKGNAIRAKSELAAFARLHPDSQGRLGGREGRYVSLLESLLAESASWPAAAASPDWPAFAGNPQRNRTAQTLVDVGAPLWRVALTGERGEGRGEREIRGAGVRGLEAGISEQRMELKRSTKYEVRSTEYEVRSTEHEVRRTKDEIRRTKSGDGPFNSALRTSYSVLSSPSPLSLLPSSLSPPPSPLGCPFHPLLIGDWVFACDARRILALRQDTGGPAWGASAVIFQTDPAGETATATVPQMFGLPMYTMTIFLNRLYARMGSVMTGRPAGTSPPADRSCLVCLDLAAEGRLLWKIETQDGWTLEGSPVADDFGVYAALRRGEVRPQAAVACFDPDTGRLRWRRAVCSAETPTHGTAPECTHNLLTLAEGALYYNTNLGAVAAIRADDGAPLWVRLYPRALRGDLARPATHWRRSLTPCVFHRGMLYVAPADSPRIFALDAGSGRMLWQTGDETADATDLLGTAGDWLIASGRRLFWIGLRDGEQGRVKHVWPDAADRPGRGRGILTFGDKQSDMKILWPTGDKLHVFDARTARLERVYDLAVRGATGGNILISRGRLLIAAESELIMIGTAGGNGMQNAK
jgi:outer membrane protein assembly factor BamB